MSDVSLDETKTFSDYFGGSRTNPNCRAITSTGLVNLKIINCMFTNYLSFEGSAIYRCVGDENATNISEIQIIDSKFYNNVAEDGTIYLCDKALNVNINNCEFYNNYSQISSAISMWGCKAQLSNVNIHKNNFVHLSINMVVLYLLVSVI